MPLLAMILSLKLNISVLLWLARRAHATDYYNLCLFEQNCREERRPPTAGWRVGQCNYIILVSPGLDIFECNPTWTQLQMWALTQISNARVPSQPSLTILMSASFVWMFVNSFSLLVHISFSIFTKSAPKTHKYIILTLDNLLNIEVLRCSGILIKTLLWILTNLNLSSGLNNEWLCRVDFVWVWIMAGGWLVAMRVIMGRDWYLIHSYQLWSRIFNVKQNINHVSIRRIECGDSATDTHN